ncbi:MAG: hypothetical protein SFT68_01615 [Rickettsiaceae bacterium]|nr:hypothetical protein [Rickettsiaceae bacterium]
MTRGGESFPRMRESSLTISWIPFFKGMTRRRAVIPTLPLIVIPTKVGIQNQYLLDPLFQGDDKGRAVIPTKVGIQNQYLLDPLFRGDDKKKGCHSPSLTSSWITFFKEMT